MTLAADDELRIEYVAADGAATVLKGGDQGPGGRGRRRRGDARAGAGRVPAEQIADAKEQGLLFSLHLKATMMKVSDPIIFGHAVRAFFAGVFTEHHDALEKLGASPNNGLGAILSALDELPDGEGDAIRAAIDKTYETAPALVDGGLRPRDHEPARAERRDHRRVDAGDDPLVGPAVERQGRPQDTKAVIPDHSYAALYAETIDFCREHGAFDPATMGTTPNVGLMAQKAEEYGSHDKTFEIAANGRVRVVDSAGDTLIEHEVEAGDIWRACQTKDAPVRDWVRLAVERARATGAPAVFWLDRTRAHDAEMLKKVEAYLAEHDTDGLQIEILPVARGDAVHARARQARRGHDLGHRQRAARLPDRPVPDPRARHEREDALDRAADAGRRAVRDGRRRLGAQARAAARQGEPPALGLARRVPRAGGVARVPGRQDRQPARQGPGETLDAATGELLENGKSPQRKVGQLDNRGSHFYLALYWAQALADQSDDPELADAFKPLAERLAGDEEKIVGELDAVQGEAVDLGGYYFVDREKADAVMRPSETFNAALETLPPRRSWRAGVCPRARGGHTIRPWANERAMRRARSPGPSW